MATLGDGGRGQIEPSRGFGNRSLLDHRHETFEKPGIHAIQKVTFEITFSNIVFRVQVPHFLRFPISSASGGSSGNLDGDTTMSSRHAGDHRYCALVSGSPSCWRCGRPAGRTGEDSARHRDLSGELELRRSVWQVSRRGWHR